MLLEPDALYLVLRYAMIGIFNGLILDRYYNSNRKKLIMQDLGHEEWIHIQHHLDIADADICFFLKPYLMKKSVELFCAQAF